jgi:hypothetical protein
VVRSEFKRRSRRLKYSGPHVYGYISTKVSGKSLAYIFRVQVFGADKTAFFYVDGYSGLKSRKLCEQFITQHSETNVMPLLFSFINN